MHEGVPTPNREEVIGRIKEELSSLDSEKLANIAEGKEYSEITLSPDLDIDESTIQAMAKEIMDSKE
ncbi:hypothetical protein GW764_03110 [Candidatus Parcubacteria bacterium]|nr:hypothetical protein [Candidatus Parcubacteria bacterium]